MTARIDSASATCDHRIGAVLRWLPTFLGFPAGGLAAKLVVGPVDGIGPAVVGGLLSGLALGAAQGIALRRHGLSRAAWLAATTVGAAAGIAGGAVAVDYRYTTAALAAQGAIAGATVGLAQATVLAGRLGALAIGWPPLISGLWALGWTVTASIGVDVDARYTVFGSSGALVVTVVTSLLPLLLRSRPAGDS